MESNRKVRTGKVVSDKMNKTVVVLVENLVRHPLYGKVIRKVKKFKAHDENNSCHVGDVVRIVETRPLSKDKRWRVIEVLKAGRISEVLPEEITGPEIEVKET